MPLEAGLFENFYASPIQHPALLWLSAAVALIVVSTREGLHPTLRRYCVFLVALSFCDAWLTTNEVFGLGHLPEWASGVVPFFFVLAGDLRYLALVMLARPDGSLAFDGRDVGKAVGLMLIVPVGSQVILEILPESIASSRVLYLTYELGFVALVVVLLLHSERLRASAWLRSVSRFVILYYSLWAGADAIILLLGWDLGFALRVVPNMLYYGGLIAMIAVAASDSGGGAAVERTARGGA